MVIFCLFRYVILTKGWALCKNRPRITFEIVLFVVTIKYWILMIKNLTADILR